MNIYRLILFLAVCLSSVKASAQQYRKIEVADLQELLHPPIDSIYILNFWATWCAPCVAELPLFVNAEMQFKDSKIRFFFISLDFKKEYDTKVIPFLLKNLTNSHVLLLGDSNYNNWINLVNPQWQGAIPATFVVSADTTKCKFYEGEFTEKKLFEFLLPLK